MKVLFFGSSGPLSLIPLELLLQSGHTLCAVGYESVSDYFKYPVFAASNETVEILARRAGIPVIPLFDSEGDYVEAVKTFAPDIIIVSCLSGKLPVKVLDIPVLGCFNLHPSLLPAFRGPVPLFWQFRKGVEQFGITLHRMTAGYDNGPIVAQTSLTLPDGINNQSASEKLASTGTVLLGNFLDRVSSGEIIERIQDEDEASYMSYPLDSDFVVSTAWSARRMYNFICANQHWGKTYSCEVAGNNYPVIEALSYRTLPDPEAAFAITDNIITIPCSDGVVEARTGPGQ